MASCQMYWCLYTMVDESIAHFKMAVQDRLAEFLGCRWVALYPTPLEALYGLQSSALGPSYPHQIRAFCDERSQQYSLLSAIMGSHPIDRCSVSAPDRTRSLTLRLKRDLNFFGGNQSLILTSFTAISRAL